MRTKTYYRVCPSCGAHLDPGEHCDCQEIKQGRGRTHEPIRTGKDRLQYVQAGAKVGRIRRI